MIYTPPLQAYNIIALACESVACRIDENQSPASKGLQSGGAGTTSEIEAFKDRQRRSRESSKVESQSDLPVHGHVSLCSVRYDVDNGTAVSTEDVI